MIFNLAAQSKTQTSSSTSLLPCTMRDKPASNCSTQWVLSQTGLRLALAWIVWPITLARSSFSSCPRLPARALSIVYYRFLIPFFPCFGFPLVDIRVTAALHAEMDYLGTTLNELMQSHHPIARSNCLAIGDGTVILRALTDL